MAKIMIIDDDPVITELLKTRLESNGYKVVTASDAIQSVGKAYDEKPDLILLDYMLPAGDGLGVFDKLKQSVNTKNTPVIFITGYTREGLKDEVMERGAKGFMEKPFESEELLAKIKEVLGN